MKEIVMTFKIDGEIKSIYPYANGLVNKTYLVITTTNKYLLQMINNYVFVEPDKLMKNIEKITNHLKRKLQLTLTIIKTKENKTYLYHEISNKYYRMYDFLGDLYTRDISDNQNLCLEIGKAIGEFQANLNDFKSDLLYETIPNFHNTPKRLTRLMEIKQTSIDSKRFVKGKEIYDYILDKKEDVYILQDSLDKGLIPLRITHNDTKLNNIMFDRKTNKARCLIDLDTVMPGIAIFDFGDAVRSSCASLSEDNNDFKNVKLSSRMTTELMIGYLSKMYIILNKKEIEHLIDAIGVIILECTIRFITDYFENDVYFHTLYDDHNLTRAYNQMYLHKSFCESQNKLKKTCLTIYNRMTKYLVE